MSSMGGGGGGGELDIFWNGPMQGNTLKNDSSLGHGPNIDI